MRLFLNQASPYARLARVVVHEKCLADQVELVWTDPWASPPELLAVNPAAKVPALVTDDDPLGTTLATFASQHPTLHGAPLAHTLPH